jgi:hypothetical protein
MAAQCVSGYHTLQTTGCVRNVRQYCHGATGEVAQLDSCSQHRWEEWCLHLTHLLVPLNSSQVAAHTFLW